MFDRTLTLPERIIALEKTAQDLADKPSWKWLGGILVTILIGVFGCGSASLISKIEGLSREVTEIKLTVTALQSRMPSEFPPSTYRADSEKRFEKLEGVTISIREQLAANNVLLKVLVGELPLQNKRPATTTATGRALD